MTAATEPVDPAAPPRFTPAIVIAEPAPGWTLAFTMLAPGVEASAPYQLTDNAPTADAMLVLQQIQEAARKALARISEHVTDRTTPPTSPSGRYIVVAPHAQARAWSARHRVPWARVFRVYEDGTEHLANGVRDDVPVVHLGIPPGPAERVRDALHDLGQTRAARAGT